MLHRDVHGVGHFSTVLPQVQAPCHGHRLRNLEAQGFVPEGQLLAEILGDVAAGVIPEIAPVEVAAGVEGARRGVAQKALPVDVLLGHVGIERTRPLRLSVGRVAVHARLDDRDLAHPFGLQELRGVGQVAARNRLVADLHRAAWRALHGGTHALGLLHRKGHGFFQVDVLAGIERLDEGFAMQMLWRGDDDRIDGAIVQQLAVIQVQPGTWSEPGRVFQAAGVNVGDGDTLGVLAGQRLSQQFGPARAHPDDAETHAFAGCQHVAAGQRAREASGHSSDEIAARLHGWRELERLYRKWDRR